MMKFRLVRDMWSECRLRPRKRQRLYTQVACSQLCETIFHLPRLQKSSIGTIAEVRLRVSALLARPFLKDGSDADLASVRHPAGQWQHRDPRQHCSAQPLLQMSFGQEKAVWLALFALPPRRGDIVVSRCPDLCNWSMVPDSGLPRVSSCSGTLQTPLV